MQRFFILFALFTLCGCGLSGCGGGGGNAPNNPGPTPTSRSIIGTWKITNLATGQTISPCPASITLGGRNITCAANETFIFKSDGSFVASTPQQSQEGTYSFDGTTLNANTPGPGSTQVTFGGDIMTWTSSFEDNVNLLQTDTFSLTLQKQ